MDSQQRQINAIAAIGKSTRVIGAANKLLWYIPEDLKRFKRLTSGHPVIMGRKTFESILSILGKPLPNRTNIVITRNDTYDAQGAEVVTSFEEALARGNEMDEEVFIIGGQQIYEQALPYTDRLYLTLVHSDSDGDAWFPPYEGVFTKEVERESNTTKSGLHYTWVILERP